MDTYKKLIGFYTKCFYVKFAKFSTKSNEDKESRKKNSGGKKKKRKRVIRERGESIHVDMEMEKGRGEMRKER